MKFLEPRQSSAERLGIVGIKFCGFHRKSVFVTAVGNLVRCMEYSPDYCSHLWKFPPANFGLTDTYLCLPSPHPHGSNTIHNLSLAKIPQFFSVGTFMISFAYGHRLFFLNQQFGNQETISHVYFPCESWIPYVSIVESWINRLQSLILGISPLNFFYMPIARWVYYGMVLSVCLKTHVSAW